MKILFLCYEHPATTIAGSHRVLYSLKYLSEKHGHDITLLATRLMGHDYPDLSRYCRVETVEIPRRPGLGSPGTLMAALRGIASLHKVFSGYPILLNHSYLPELDKKIGSLLRDSCDVIAVDHPDMLGYAMGRKIPMVLLEAFAIAEVTRMEYEFERHPLKKAFRLLYHYETRGYAKQYRSLDASIAVSAAQRDMVLSHDPRMNIVVIPYGVDTDYFRAVEPETAFPSLIITGQMTGPRNLSGVVGFYDETYPLIKEKVPEVKLYIVGNNPDKEVLRLADDRSVTVTGYVPDLRPYLSRAWVVVAPLQEGFGVKVRVLQAMAVGKPVVSTTAVTTGIDVSPGEHILIADKPSGFAEGVIRLVRDRQLREKMGAAARLLMETEHSWEKLTDRLNEVLKEAAAKKPATRRK